eukprot:3560003-Rhodomonas_salina.1
MSRLSKFQIGPGRAKGVGEADRKRETKQGGGLSFWGGLLTCPAPPSPFLKQTDGAAGENL